MDFELKTLTLTSLCTEKSGAVLVLIPQDFNPGGDTLSLMAAGALKSGDFENKPGRLLGAYRVPGVTSSRVMLVGVGDGSSKNIRTAVGAALGALKGSNVQTAVLYLGALGDARPDGVRAAVVACGEAGYAYSTTKSKSTPEKLKRVVVGVRDAASAKAGFSKGVALVNGLDFAKEWANRPANHATPAQLAGAAKGLGKLPRIKVEILGPKDVEKLGMGAFMAVAQGAAEPLRLIVLRYTGAPGTEAPHVLIGKGITFDTGGISIKPAAEMDEMKFDMCGAASVLGTFRVLAEMQPRLNVVGVIPACENMPDGRAVKPGDVVTSMSGQTIEILNTDAEGRLVLCDALTYVERFKPKAVIDIATLTGACVVALGGVRSGLFSNDESLARALADASASSQDLCWRMPLDEDYAEGLKTNFADVANIAGRAAGAVTAAKFLQRFSSKFPWAHLDIAGTAWKGGSSKGATGRPVALLVDYLMGQVLSDTHFEATPKSVKSVKSGKKPQAVSKTRA